MFLLFLHLCFHLTAGFLFLQRFLIFKFLTIYDELLGCKISVQYRQGNGCKLLKACHHLMLFCFSLLLSWQRCLELLFTVWQCQQYCMQQNRHRSANTHQLSPLSLQPASTLLLSSFLARYVIVCILSLIGHDCLTWCIMISTFLCRLKQRYIQQIYCYWYGFNKIIISSFDNFDEILCTLGSKGQQISFQTDKKNMCLHKFVWVCMRAMHKNRLWFDRILYLYMTGLFGDCYGAD